MPFHFIPETILWSCTKGPGVPILSGSWIDVINISSPFGFANLGSSLLKARVQSIGPRAGFRIFDFTGSILRPHRECRWIFIDCIRSAVIVTRPWGNRVAKRTDFRLAAHSYLEAGLPTADVILAWPWDIFELACVSAGPADPA